MTRIALLTLTALAALALAATAAAGNAPRAAAGDLFAQPAACRRGSPRSARDHGSTRKPRAKVVRHLSFDLVPNEITSVFRGCIQTYWASWGGWETQCAFNIYSQQVYVYDHWRYYYWDGGCWRLWMYYSRQAGNLFGAPYPWSVPLYPAQRTCF